ncbi:MAG: SDR family NAD(P)-dependent oxidoreductase, partial [Chitinophagales bacterium]
INHISPYLLIQGLSPLLKASKYKNRLIINVSSAEGQFSYSNKTIYHPHTNMTKAALNMLTRTSAKEYARYGIYMNSVDVGWVSTGATESLRKVQFEQAYIPPLDSVDAASRILHPIVSILQEETIFIGQLLKNYQVEAW